MFATLVKGRKVYFSVYNSAPGYYDSLMEVYRQAIETVVIKIQRAGGKMPSATFDCELRVPSYQASHSGNAVSCYTMRYNLSRPVSLMLYNLFPRSRFISTCVRYLVSQCKRPFQKNLTPSASPLTICALPRLTSVSSDRRRRTGGS